MNLLKRRYLKLLKRSLRAAIPALVIVALAWHFWPNLGHWSWPSIIISSLILALAFARIQANRIDNLQLDHFRIFLEYLSARIAAGETIESALQGAAKALKHQLGGRSHFYNCLQVLSRSLSAQISLERSLNIFQADFGHPKAKTFARILPFLNRYGGRADIFIRQTHRSLCSEIAMQKEIQAEHSAKNSEAFILLFLPFVMAGLIGRGSYGQALNQLPAANLILSSLFILAVFAASVSLFLIARQNPYQHKLKQVPHLKVYRLRPLDYSLASFYLRLLPAGLGWSLARAVAFVYRNHPSDPWPHFIKQKTKLLVASLIASLGLLIFSRQYYSLALPFVACLAHDLRLIETRRRLEEAYHLEYPDFLNLMTILLRSGLSLSKSISLQAGGIQPQTRQVSVLEADIVSLDRKIQNSFPADQALAQLSLILPSREISTALNVIVRHARDGGQELLDILEIQANSCWQVYRNAMRSKLERQNLALVLPMGLDLIVILAITILPAIVSFRAV